MPTPPSFPPPVPQTSEQKAHAESGNERFFPFTPSVFAARPAATATARRLHRRPDVHAEKKPVIPPFAFFFMRGSPHPQKTRGLLSPPRLPRPPTPAAAHSEFMIAQPVTPRQHAMPRQQFRRAVQPDMPAYLPPLPPTRGEIT